MVGTLVPSQSQGTRVIEQLAEMFRTVFDLEASHVGLYKSSIDDEMREEDGQDWVTTGGD